LNSFAELCVPAATLATLAATSGTTGAMVYLSVWVRPGIEQR
jgi:phenylacetate-coenzyme A ligase PaaK-like adenylate-forming protein